VSEHGVERVKLKFDMDMLVQEVMEGFEVLKMRGKMYPEPDDL